MICHAPPADATEGARSRPESAPAGASGAAPDAIVTLAETPKRWPQFALDANCPDLMRIACPNCAAAYEVPDRLLHGTPRPLRCARCATTWTPPRLAPAETVPAAAAVAAPPPFPPSPAPPPPPPPSARDDAVAAEEDLAPPPFPPPPLLATAAATAAEDRISPASPLRRLRAARAPQATTTDEPPPPPSVPASVAPPPEDATPGRGGGRAPALGEGGPAVGGTGLAAAWIASFVALALLVAALLLFRAEVMEAWPASARLYAALGLLPGG